MSTPKVLVFGATGTVGAATAHAAAAHGAEVVLAVRDLSKPMPNTPAAQDKAFRRIQADLSVPSTLHAAASATGATRAFLYVDFASTDGMRASLEALRSGGVDFAVLLSTAGIRGDPADVADDHPVFAASARAERSLRAVFGARGYVAVRPASFASNTLWWADMVRAGDVRLAYPRAASDHIAPGDIGRVSGAVLARGADVLGEIGGGFNDVRLFGPALVAQEDAVLTIARVLGKEGEVRVRTVDEEEFLGIMTRFLPPVVAKVILEEHRTLAGSEGDGGFFAEEQLRESAAVIEKLGGSPATTFEQWVEENKALFE